MSLRICCQHSSIPWSSRLQKAPGMDAGAASMRIEPRNKQQQHQQQQVGKKSLRGKTSPTATLASASASGGEGGVYTKLGWRSLHALRALVLVIVLLHVGVSTLAIVVAVASSKSKCPHSLMVGAAVVAIGAGVRIVWVIGTGLCQAATAVTMIAEEQVPASQVTQGAPVASTLTRIERRMWYKRWLWWGRFGAIVTFLQIAGASYLSFLAVRNAHSSFCFSESHAASMLQNALVVLPIVTWILALAQCCVGSDVLSWRSLYEMQNEAWRAHYREMFDHGIRELLCCLGRSRYLTTMDEDEVDSVAALLGDLVAYRAAGASHLEFLAGIALLRTRRPKSPVPIDFPPAPEPLMREAAVLHPYAVAAYTGPLLDIGRNPLFFPCAWMYRQGILTLWNRHRRPILDGDNWWRGHAAAFLRAARLPAEALLKGRVHQRNRETVYFVVELRQLQCVVVAVRGTETPEDLLTDGLGRECVLSESDIKGLLMTSTLSDTVKQEIASSRPHYGHAGVMHAARELAFELDSPEDNPLNEDDPSGSSCSPRKRVGFLTSIFAPGGRCEGFALRFVGHSLGGSIAAVAGMMLCHRFPNLHVYGYGVLPCVDAVLAEACSGFMTSVVYNDEFSSRLSVASVMRLRAAALRALAADSDTDSAVIAKLARRLLGSNRSKFEHSSNGSRQSEQTEGGGARGSQQHRRRRFEHKLKGGVFLCYHACHCLMDMPKDNQNTTGVTAVGVPVCRLEHDCPSRVVYHGQARASDSKLDGNDGNHVVYQVVPCRVDDAGVASDGKIASLNAGIEANSVEEAVGLMSGEDMATKAAENGESFQVLDEGDLLSNGMPSEEDSDLVGFKPGADLQQLWPVELVMPGLVIHLIRIEERTSSWRNKMRRCSRPRRQHKAILRDRDSFRDVIVSPSMFLDHMPWRCQRALNDVLEQVPKGPLPDRQSSEVLV